MNFLSHHLRYFILIVLAALAIHGQTIQHQFMVDDYIFIDPQMQANFTKPLDYFQVEQDRHYAPLYHMVNVNLFRYFSDSPTIPHAFILLCFILCCFSIYSFIYTLTKDQLLGFLTVFLVIIHPINAFTVQFITANFVFIATGLTLTAFILHVSSISSKKKTLLNFLALICFGISILFSEVSVILPAFLVLYHICISKSSLIQSISKTILYWIAAGVYIVFFIYLRSDTMHLGQSAQILHLTPIEYISSFTYLSIWYLANLINPKNIVFIQSMHPIENGHLMYVGFLILFVGIVGYAVLFKWKRDLKTFFCLFFLSGFSFVALAILSHPYMGLVMEPHWIFLFSIGFFALFASFFIWISRFFTKNVFIILCVALFMFYSMETFRYHKLAQTEQRYLLYWTKQSPNNFIPWMRLAQITAKEQKFQEAIIFANVAYNNAVYDKFLASLELGKFYFLIGGFNQAETYLLQASSIRPNHVMPYSILGELYAHLQQPEKAEKYFLIAHEKYKLLYPHAN